MPRLPDGSQQTSCRKVALDFAVINALGQGHRDATLREAGAAAEAYSRRKRLHLDTAKKCHDAGVYFMPVVLEAQGGMSGEAAGVFHRIAAAVADLEGTKAKKVEEELMQHLALIRARSNASAIARRRAGQRSLGDRAVAQFGAMMTHLEEAG